MCVQDLDNNLNQGGQFYNRLLDHLSNLTQNISDFKQAREAQAEEMCSQLGLPKPQFGDGGFNPYATGTKFNFGNIS